MESKFRMSRQLLSSNRPVSITEVSRIARVAGEPRLAEGNLVAIPRAASLSPSSTSGGTDPAHELLDCLTAILANVESVRLAVDQGLHSAIEEALADIDSDALRGSRLIMRLKAGTR